MDVKLVIMVNQNLMILLIHIEIFDDVLLHFDGQDMLLMMILVILFELQCHLNIFLFKNQMKKELKEKFNKKFLTKCLLLRKDKMTNIQKRFISRII